MAFYLMVSDNIAEDVNVLTWKVESNTASFRNNEFLYSNHK